MKILNLFAGIGGNRTLWGNEHDITAVENNQQIALIYYKRFPNDKVIIGDAYEYCLWNYDKFDFIWASPECYTHSWMNNVLHTQNIRRYPDLRLWQIIIFLKKFCKTNWVVENVKPYYEDHIKPNFIIGRHYYWSNLKIPNEGFKFSQNNILNSKKSTRRINSRYFEELCEFYQVDSKLLEILNTSNYKNHDIKCQILRNCVPPKIGKYILDAINTKTLIDFIEVENAN